MLLNSGGVKANLPILSSVFSVMNFHTTACVERARQSTRLRKRKVALTNKKRKEDRLRKNPPPLPLKVRLMLKAKGITGKPEDSREEDVKQFPTDNVCDEKFFTWPRLSLEEALVFLRQHYHPTMMDDPNGIVMIRVEVDLSTGKKDKYMEPFSKMVPLFHSFERGVVEKTVLVFAKTPEDQNAALEAGAKKAGGLDLIDDISKGKLDVIDFDYFLAHDDIANELKPLLGILRDQFPKKTLGTVGTDLVKMVKTFSNGQLIEVVKPKPTLGAKEDPTFGYSEVMIGRLDMKDEHIKINLDTILESLKESAPKKSAGFLQRVKIYIDDRLYNKMSIHHDLISDKKWKDHVKQSVKA
jgi:ribosomal protein L1